MTPNKENISISGISVLMLVFLNAVIAKIAFTAHPSWYWILIFTMPLLFIAVWDMRKKKDAALHNSQAPGHPRYFFKHKARAKTALTLKRNR